MRTGILFLFVLGLVACAKKQHHQATTSPSGPPGMIRLTDSLYVGATEVTNGEYLEYLKWLKAKYQEEAPELVTLARPDTLVWIQGKSQHPGMVEYYLRHPAYRNHPVVGLTWAQANDYCQRLNEWRTEQGVPTFGISRLPKAKEWEKAAASGLDPGAYPFGYQSVYGPNRERLLNSRDNYATFTRSKIKGLPQEVTYGPPTGLGFYNTIGNVAEMINQEGVSKGGSWRHPLERGAIRASIPYFFPADWLGFRCACVLEEPEPDPIDSLLNRR